MTVRFVLHTSSAQGTPGGGLAAGHAQIFRRRARHEHQERKETRDGSEGSVGSEQRINRETSVTTDTKLKLVSKETLYTLVRRGTPASTETEALQSACISKIGSGFLSMEDLDWSETLAGVSTNDRSLYCKRLSVVRVPNNAALSTTHPKEATLEIAFECGTHTHTRITNLHTHFSG
jgi:hypothetical protein